ncbi:uncharacterized protein LOC117326012 [Pecten maximus]|uniref:uncharacterized protein LOC117326012 n=1 Tax=Pecten maximus TaxID=6579 RepID=UPI001458EB4F|nr:uncharacterized protein LOC117326012 [Pecten maximus]
MFTLRAAPRHYPECYWDRRPSTCRQAFSPGHMSRPTTDSRLLQDLTESILLPFLGAITSHNEDTPCRQHERSKIKQWTHRLNLKGYGPDDVTITTREGRVLIKARRIEGQGDCSDIYESHRTITIPKYVDVSSMKSRFTPDGMLTIEAKLITKDNNQTFRELEVQLDKAEHKQKSEPIQDGKVNTTEERENDVSEPYIEGEQIQSANHRDDVIGGADPECIIEYPESIDSIHEKVNFEIVEPKMPSISGDIDPNQETDVTIEHDQYLYNHKPSAGPCSHNKQEMCDED